MWDFIALLPDRCLSVYFSFTLITGYCCIPSFAAIITKGDGFRFSFLASKALTKSDLTLITLF